MFEAERTVYHCALEQLQGLERKKLVTSDPAGIAEIDGSISSIRGALNMIQAAATEREEKKKRDLAWQEIQPRCRHALDEVHRLAREVEVARAVAAAARDAAENAEGAFNRARSRRPRPETYPTASELDAQRRLEDDLSAKLDRARVALREANQNADSLAVEHLQARNEFSRLEFQERTLRPREVAVAR